MKKQGQKVQPKELVIRRNSSFTIRDPYGSASAPTMSPAGVKVRVVKDQAPLKGSRTT